MGVLLQQTEGVNVSGATGKLLLVRGHKILIWVYQESGGGRGMVL